MENFIFVQSMFVHGYVKQCSDSDYHRNDGKNIASILLVFSPINDQTFVDVKIEYSFYHIQDIFKGYHSCRKHSDVAQGSLTFLAQFIVINAFLILNKRQENFCNLY